MTKVEIDGKTYCVETLIYEVERLTKEVKASAEYHRLVLEQIMTEIKDAYDDNRACEQDDIAYGLKVALDIIKEHTKGDN